MLKKIALLALAVTSVGVLAETTDQSRTVKLDTTALCVSADKLYSIGDRIKSASGETLKCFQPGWGTSGTNKTKTAHWDKP